MGMELCPPTITVLCVLPSCFPGCGSLPPVSKGTLRLSLSQYPQIYSMSSTFSSISSLSASTMPLTATRSHKHSAS